MTASDKLKKALLILMEVKPLSQIQVKELIEEAGVSRSSFYRNYDSVYDVSEELEKEFFDGLRECNRGCFQSEMSQDLEVPDTYILNTLRYQQEHAEVLLALSGPHGEPSVREEAVRLLRELFVGRIWFNHGRVKYNDFYEAFVTSGYIDAVRYWLTNRPDIPAEQMAVIIAKLMYGFFAVN